MKKIILIFFVIVFNHAGIAQSEKKHDEQNLERPKLVVGIVVDQMRWDYLYRYYDRYSSNGFKRLINQGFSANNTNIDYVPTVTAIGHTSVYTGSVPSIHGIAGNDFIIEQTGESMYCSADSTVRTVGSNSKAGEMSPRNLLSSTITDELKLATNFKSKVIGIALKDRASILPAGHAADAAYWFDGENGKWITSTWYMKALPAWVNEINKGDLVGRYLTGEWNTMYPISSYEQSTADNNKYEGKFKGTESPLLPVNLNKLLKDNGPGIIRSTPLGNTMTLDMAKAAIKNESLGKNGHTDFLTISFSSTDHIGHQFGPNSIEIEDTYLRLDKELGSFLNYLDEQVGEGDYTVFLTADHGAAHNVGFMQENKMNAGGWEINATLKSLNEFLYSKFNVNNLVLSLLYYQVHFNNKEVLKRELDPEAVKLAAIGFLKNQQGVAYVVDMEKTAVSSVPSLLRERIINGYHQKRSGAVQIILEPSWYYSYGSSSALTGTDHSSWNPYDAHIPLIFMGWGVKQGKTSRPTHMTDIAATIAALLNIQQPNGNIGTPILEVLK